MKNRVVTVIDQAKSFLEQQKYDDAHDLAHHIRVWDISKQILQNINTTVNEDVLQIACMWHDVLIKKYVSAAKNHKLITQETAEYLRKYMTKQGFTNNDSYQVYLAIKYHELDNKPLNVEGKILFDADKIDAFNPSRSLWFANSRQGKNSLWRIKVFFLKNRLVRKYVKRKFHYKYSRLLFEKSIKEQII